MTKQKIISLRVTGEQKDAIDKEADRIGLSTSAFLLLLFRQFVDGVRFEKKLTDNRKGAS